MHDSKFSRSVIFSALFGFASMAAAADGARPTPAGPDIVDISAQALFVPQGYDDNDEIVVVLDGYLPNSCHRMLPAKVTVDKRAKRITLQQKSRRFSKNCREFLTIPFDSVIPLGSLPEGEYSVVTADGKLKEKLKVKKATGPNADDFLYAPVNFAHVEMAPSGTMGAVIGGRFTNTCMNIEEMRIVPTGRTIQVLPIMASVDTRGGGCRAQESRFQKAIKLPELLPGRYLLHVRSLNGESVNEVFSNEWPLVSDTK